MLGGQISIGIAMIVLTVVIHTAGIVVLVAFLRDKGIPIVGRRNYIGVMGVLVLTIVGLFLLHTVEIWSWAALYVLVCPHSLYRLLY